MRMALMRRERTALAVLALAGMCLGAESPANLLLNPSFEDWPDGEPLPRHWTSNAKEAPEHVSRVEALGTDGEYAAVIRDGTMGNALRQTVPVEPGKYYNLSVDVKTDIGMWEFRLMPYWTAKNGMRLKDANRASGEPFARVKSPWTRITLRNYLAPTNAAHLVFSLVPNDAWSNARVKGTITLDNACVCESGSVVDDAPVAVRPTDVLSVVGAELSPKYNRAGIRVKAGRESVEATLVAEEPLENGKAVVGARKDFRLAANEERSVFAALETCTPKTRLSVWIGKTCVWRKAFAGTETFLALGLQDPYAVRKGEVFVPNDARWYVNFPLAHNLPVDRKKNVNRIVGNPTNLNARMFFEVPEGISITAVKYSDWGGDLPVRKPLASEPVVKNGCRLTCYELPVYISGINMPLVFFTSTCAAGTQARGYAYLTWNGGAQVPLELTFTTVSYGRVEPFRRMQMRMDDLTPNLASALCDDPAHELPTLGVNAMAVPLKTSPKTDPARAAFVAKAQASGLKWFFQVPNEIYVGTWANDLKWANPANLKGDSDARFILRDGTPAKSQFGWIPPCPTYRGTNFLATAKYVLESPAVKDYGLTWLVCDWECWGENPCCCDRCRRIFREGWCRKHGLPDFGDPREFLVDEKANAAAAKAYRDFYAFARGTVYADFKKELDKGLDPKRMTWCSPIEGRFTMSEWTAPQKRLKAGIDVFDWPFGYKSPESVLTLVENVFTNELDGKTGQFTCSVCPMQGCELNEKYPPESAYYNILEAATLGTRGFEWWFAPICESMTWKYVMDGLREIRSHEDLILDGTVTVRGEGENCTWRKIEKGGEALYLVRNYQLTKPTTVRFTDNGRTFTAELGPKHLAKLIHVK